MARDIEDFLKRAAERRKQAQGGGSPARPAPPRAAPPRPAKPKPASAARRLSDEANTPTDDPYATKAPKVAKPANVPVSAPRRKPPVAPPVARRESIEEHVRRAIVVTDVTENASHLAEEISLADERLEERLERFDHSMGSLEGSDTVTDDVTAKVEGPNISPVARDMIEMFRNQKSIRQAILVNEILKRPDFD